MGNLSTGHEIGGWARFSRAFAALALSICAGSCSTGHYRESADRATYKAIAGKSGAVPGMDTSFTIEQAAMPALDGLPMSSEKLEFLGPASDIEDGARTLTLEKALELAVKHNRAYQNQKEALYLEALNLTLERRQYKPFFSGTGKGSYARGTTDVTKVSTLADAVRSAPDIVREIGDLAGTPADLLDSYTELVKQTGAVTGLDAAHVETLEQRSVGGQSGFGVDWLLQGGARIAVDLTSNFLRFLTGDPGVSTTSALVGSITQPLWRGAGRRYAAEKLTQAERDLLYALRDFARYRQQFTVQVSSDYYRVLQDRDAARNNYLSYNSFAKNTERERAFAAEGQRTVADVGRLEQAELLSENSWLNSVRQYQQGLDQFKIELGLPTDIRIVLDDQELKRLKEKGIIHPNITVEDAAKVALASRLDLYTQRDKKEDAGRKAAVAANALKPGLNLVAGATVPSKPGNRFQELDFERSQLSAGLDVDLPLNRATERTSYRAALIARDRAERDLNLGEDNVKLGVRDALRSLEQAKQAYEIALKGVELNARRVEEQNLLGELGRATALNQVDAQNDLTQAENSLTAALVGHTVARIGFWRDMGILFIKEDGQWEEVTDVPEP